MKKGLVISLHVVGVTAISFALFAVPILANYKNINSDSDVNAGATIPLPDVPSGEFLILMKSSKHQENISDWETFFLYSDREYVPVIFDDITCSIADSDFSARELGTRYQAYLPVNQMKIKYENATLLVSKVEQGYFDVAIFSLEVANYLKLKDGSLIDDVAIFNYKGEIVDA